MQHNCSAPVIRLPLWTATILLLAFAMAASRPASAAPTVSSISPSSAYATAAGFTMTVVGTGFSGQCKVQWNGAAMTTTFISATEMTAHVSSALIAAPGTAKVTVVDGSGSASNPETFTINPAPAIGSLSPSTAIATGPAFTLTVTGSNFAADSVVTWKGSALTTTFVSATTVTAQVPSTLIATAGTATVAVTSATAPATSNLTFTITVRPTLQSISPSNILAGSAGFTMTVTGVNLTSDETVTWNGASLPTTDVSSTQLTATVASSLLAVVSSATVGAVTGNGITASSPQTFTILPPPSITSISPSSAIAGSAGFDMTITGKDFAGSYGAKWNGAGLATTFVSSTQLTAHVPSTDIATTGMATVTVATTTGIASNGKTFTITSGPVLSSISPTSCLAGSPTFTMTLVGANFQSDSVVSWNRAALPTTWVSATKLTATVDASLVASVGSFIVAVTSATAPSTGSLTFKVTGKPTILNISPTTLLAGSPGFTLTVNGTNFASGYVIQWNGVGQTTTFVSGTQLTSLISAAKVAVAGTATVTVKSTSNQLSNSAAFTVSPSPTITSITPVNVPAGTPGVTITITGANFTGGCSVLWNGSPLNQTFISATQFTAYLPAALLTTPGTAKVTVALNGISSNSATFTIDALPTLASISPSSASAGGPSFTITATGKNFQSGAAALWNGNVLTTTFVSTTSLTASVPATDIAAPGIAQVSVMNADTAVTATTPFRILVVPTGASLWAKKLVWASYLPHYTYSIPSVGMPGLYTEIYPLDMSYSDPHASPATDVALAQAQGVDAFAVNISTSGNAAEDELTAADAASDFFVAPLIDLSSLSSSGATATQMENAVVQAIKDYAYDAATHPSAALEGSSYVIWTYHPNSMPLANWTDARSKITSAGISINLIDDVDGLFTAGTFPQTTITNWMGVFDNAYIYSGMRDSFWNQTISLVNSLGKKWAGATFAGSIKPSTGQYNDAQCTSYLRSRWDRNLADAGTTPWAISHTWNDYAEQSGMNPTSTWNETRADITAWYAAAFKSQPAPFADARIYITAPQQINLSQPATAEALILNPTANALTAAVQLFDGAGNAMGSAVNASVAANSIGAATIPINLSSVPAGRFFRARATMLDATGTTQLNQVVGAPTVVYDPGVMPSLNVNYYSAPSTHRLAGTVGLSLSTVGQPVGQAIATIAPPTGVTVKFAEILYNTAEAQQFYNLTPTTATVSTTGPGFYVARVIDSNKNVGYSDPVYVGP